jgi:L-asparaginase
VRIVTLITTGGTIEKTYDELSGELANRRSIVRRMLSELRLEETEVNVLELMSKDSQFLTDEDRSRIVEVVRAMCGVGEGEGGGIVILHGTDTLAVTGQWLSEKIPEPRVPVVLTGAMRPFEMKQSDALQNLTEAIFASGVLPAGIYCVAHGRVLSFPGVRKDPERGTFVRA